MKTMKVDVLLYDPQAPDELRVEVRIPVADATAQRLLDAQQRGHTVYSQTALYNLAGAIGFLNGKSGIPLRVREVEQ